jgi:methionyl-tRNA synthetase
MIKAWVMLLILLIWLKNTVTEAVRYYLLREIPEYDDGDFSEAE